MASQSADIGANFSNYTGTANLGEVGLGVFNIDTKPLEDLAKYTFFYNRSEYEQRQKDVEKAAAEIADVTAYDIVNGIPKFSKILQEKRDELFKYASENPTSLDYRNKKAYFEFKKMKADLLNDITAGKENEIINKVRQKAIQDEKNTAEKERMQKALDKDIEALNIRDRLKFNDQFDIEPVKYVAPKKLSFTVTKEFPNYITGTDVLTTDMADVNGQANAAITGLSKFMNPQTDLEQQQYASQKNTGKLEPILSAQNISAVISSKDANGKPLYMKDGVFDFGAAKKSGNSILSGNAANVQAYNRKMDDMTNAIKAGAFKDKLSGGVAAFGVNGIDENDYQKIDLDKGYITPLEYAKLNIMGLAEPMVTSKTEIKPTGEANDLLKARRTQEGENYRAKLAHLAKDPKAIGVIEKPALLFGQFVDTAKKYLANHPKLKGIVIDYKAVDPYIKAAVNLPDGHFLTIKRDGSYITSLDNAGTIEKTIGTIENLTQGVINAVKTIDRTGTDKDGTMAEGYQIKSENAFKELLGSSSGQEIWNNYVEEKQTKTKEVKLTDAQKFLQGIK